MNGFQTIKEFETNQRVYANALIKSVNKGMTVRRQPFLDITLTDKTGEITAKLWDVTPEQEEVLKSNTVVYVTGLVSEWNGQNQLKIEYVEEKKNADITEFVKSAPLPVDDMTMKIVNYVNDIEDEEIRNLVHYLFKRHQNEFEVYPAARGMHHAIHAGLAYHTLTMLEVAVSLQKIYPFLKKDLLIAGVVLHDLAKVSEMNAQNGIVDSYTRSGNLLGHIVQGALWIGETGKELNVDPVKIEVLQHLVLSHHGKGEWGSPQPPKMAEAVMLHHIDNIDAKMYMVNDALSNTGTEAEFTDRVRGLDNTQLFVYRM